MNTPTQGRSGDQKISRSVGNALADVDVATGGPTSVNASVTMGGELAPPFCGALAMAPHLPTALFDTGAEARLRARIDLIIHEPITEFATADPRALAELEVLITGWESPRIGPRELDLMPSLRAVFHAAGTVKGHLDEIVWQRGIRVTTAAAANAYPVAEYTLAMILLAAKGVLPQGSLVDAGSALHVADIGSYRKVVGIVGASTVGRQVIRLLTAFDFRVVLFDPLLDGDDPVLEMATRVGLDELLAHSAIVSIHAPLLTSTHGMIGARELSLLAPGTTIINTARAPIVDQDALVEAVRDHGVRAILDVTDPEPLPASHPLRRMPGVLVTPHVAGALGNELRRLGEAVVREVERYSRGLPPAYPVRLQDLTAMA